MFRLHYPSTLIFPGAKIPESRSAHKTNSPKSFPDDSGRLHRLPIPGKENKRHL
jgi:hypothetical protein